MPELFLIICTSISVMFGYLMASGTWKTKHQQEQVHTETLKILLDEAVEKEKALRTTVDILRVEIGYLRDEIEFLKEEK